MIYQPTYSRPLGSIMPITTCPHCSKLQEGSCVICEPNDPHPSCEKCKEGRIVYAWYENELLMTIATTVVVTVLSGIIISKIQSASKKK